MVVTVGCTESGDSPDAASQSAARVEGEAIVKANCRSCHLPGINGAPILGNVKMWRPRADQGRDVLVQHASEGFGLMPAKGGNAELTDTQIGLAVDYMLSLLEQ